MDKGQFDGTFKYNGEELNRIKVWANRTNPQEAIETFIYTALMCYRNPQDMLKELCDGQLDQEPLEK